MTIEETIIARVLATMPFVLGVYDWHGMLFVWVTSGADSPFRTWERAIRVVTAPREPVLTYMEPTVVYQDARVIWRREGKT